MDKTIKSIAGEKQQFSRLVLKKEEALEMFKVGHCLVAGRVLSQLRRCLLWEICLAALSCSLVWLCSFAIVPRSRVFFVQHNKFKQEIIRSKVPDGATCTAYRCGPLIDLCK